MEYTELGNSGIQVSRIGLGTWAIGGWMWGGTNERDSIETIRNAVEKGVTLVDTAPVYGMGTSEEIVGRALKRHGLRNDVVLATKCGLEWSADHKKVRRNATRQRIETEIDASLDRLQTDRIDLYQLHWPDPMTPLEETAQALADLKQAGKIRGVGVSNFNAEQVRAFTDIANLDSNQPPLNLFERDAADQILPTCKELGVGTVTYGALCRGLLSGRISADRKFSGDDLRNNDPKFQKPRIYQYLCAVGALDNFARIHYGKNVLALALRWVLDQPGHSVALWGGRTPAQLDPVNSIDGWSLDQRALADLDDIVDCHVTDPIGSEFMAPPARKAA